ncbi:MAG: hypothetical protein LBC18_13665 [Opitutaceae bacterium]|jgi:hypothetical protein|nr:hypothetical protein [Opitutaceae bacterium]
MSTVKQFGDLTLHYGAAGLATLSIGTLRSMQKRTSSPVNATATDEVGNIVSQVVSDTPDVTYTITMTVKLGTTPPKAGDVITLEAAPAVITEVSTNYTADGYGEYSVTAERKGNVDYTSVAEIDSSDGYGSGGSGEQG